MDVEESEPDPMWVQDKVYVCMLVIKKKVFKVNDK